ncbi:MAG: GNAT family N-acetyltransferase [Nitrospinota bacterium]|nr:MAG: GNAT family N-acetyltransferase [Nitrospinota bacterium]
MESDDTTLSHLSHQILGVTRERSFWQWKYRQNPAGTALSAVAVHHGTVIGQIGAIPIRFLVEGSELRAAQEVDMLIDKGHRRFDVYYRLAELRNAIDKKEGIAFKYGFAIEATSQIAQKTLGFQRVGPIPRLVKVLNSEPFLQRKLHLRAFSRLLAFPVNTVLRHFYPTKITVPPGAQMREVKRFDERFDTFWSRIKGDYPIMTVKDCRYLNWRYVDIPHLHYTIIALENIRTEAVLGFVVLYERYRDLPVGQIIDIVTPREENATVTRTLLAQALNHFHQKGMALAACWMFSHSHVFPELVALGFRARPGKGRELIFRNVNPQEPAVSPSFATRTEHWYITMGDADFY